MITILSPAKRITQKDHQYASQHTMPFFSTETNKLVEVLKNYSARKLANLMDINRQLAQLNYERYLGWQVESHQDNSFHAMLVFRGDVYQELKAGELDHQELQFAQDSVRILSGLYGVLRPLDLIQPYRLEMGTALKTQRKKDLYEFWGDKITNFLREDIDSSQGEKILVNLASGEYARAAKIPELKYPCITPVFKQLRGDEIKMVPILAKRARGLMTRYIIDFRITSAGDLQGFDYDGYFYQHSLSTDTEWIFTR